MYYLLSETQAAEAANWTLEIAKMFAPAVLVLLGLWAWHIKQRSKQRYDSLSYLNQKWLDALLKAWSLLAYITDVENPKAVLYWEKTGGRTVYYLRPKQAREYMIALSEMFYTDGYGLFLEKEVKNLFYKYRSLLYGVLLTVKNKQGSDESIQLENEHLAESIKDIYNQLNEQLRNELEKIEK